MAPGPAPCIGLLYQLAIAFPARRTAAGFRQHRSGGAIYQDESSVGIFRAFLVSNAAIFLRITDSEGALQPRRKQF